MTRRLRVVESIPATCPDCGGELRTPNRMPGGDDPAGRHPENPQRRTWNQATFQTCDACGWLAVRPGWFATPS